MRVRKVRTFYNEKIKYKKNYKKKQSCQFDRFSFTMFQKNRSGLPRALMFKKKIDDFRNFFIDQKF